MQVVQDANEAADEQSILQLNSLVHSVTFSEGDGYVLLSAVDHSYNCWDTTEKDAEARKLLNSISGITSY
jgi:hypothetical protein